MLPGATCPLREGVPLNEEHFEACDVHPNGLGHLEIGVALADAIQSVLQK